jgi:hypothetical protein
MFEPLELLKAQDFAQDIKLKKRFARFTYHITYVWVAFLLTITLMQGTGATGINHVASFFGAVAPVDPTFRLEQWAFVAVFSSTTITIFGLAMVVGRYLFGGAKRSD